MLITTRFGFMVLRSSSLASSRPVRISDPTMAMAPMTTVTGTGPVITGTPVHPTSTTAALVAVAIASPPAGGNTAQTEQADREALAETNTAAVESCTGLAP